MTRNLTIFLATFVASALVALVVRAALHQPHGDHGGALPAGGEYAPMVANELAPAGTRADGTPAQPAHAGSHADHARPGEKQPVNSVCAICGMPVDPKIPTAEYQGKTIGFGCRMCPPKFKADPDRYGPAYLRNEVLK